MSNCVRSGEQNNAGLRDLPMKVGAMPPTRRGWWEAMKALRCHSPDSDPHAGERTPKPPPSWLPNPPGPGAGGLFRPRSSAAVAPCARQTAKSPDSRKSSRSTLNSPSCRKSPNFRPRKSRFARFRLSMERASKSIGRSLLSRATPSAICLC